MKKNIIILVLVLLIIGLFFLTRGNKSMHKEAVKIVEWAKLPPRSVHIQLETKPTLHVLHENTTIVDTFWKPAVIDTPDVIRQYYETHVCKDSLHYDSTLRIFVTSYVRENNVFKNVWDIHYSPVRVEKIVTKPIRWRVLAGLGFSGNTHIFRMKAEVMLITAKGKGFGVAYYPLDNTIGVTMLWTILKSKK